MRVWGSVFLLVGFIQLSSVLTWEFLLRQVLPVSSLRQEWVYVENELGGGEAFPAVGPEIPALFPLTGVSVRISSLKANVTAAATTPCPEDRNSPDNNSLSLFLLWPWKKNFFFSWLTSSLLIWFALFLIFILVTSGSCTCTGPRLGKGWHARVTSHLCQYCDLAALLAFSLSPS